MGGYQYYKICASWLSIDKNTGIEIIKAVKNSIVDEHKLQWRFIIKNLVEEYPMVLSIQKIN